MIVRGATEADIPQVLVLWEEMMDFHAERDPHFRRRPDGRVGMEAFYRSKMADPEAFTFIVEHEGVVVGHCMGWIAKLPPVFLEEFSGGISDIAVAASARRLGAGKALCDAAVVWFKERGISRVELSVASSNEVSKAFWKSMGFGPFMERLIRHV